MTEPAEDTSEPMAAQLATWAEEQDITLGDMRARVAANRAAMAATAARMARMVEKAGTRAAPDQTQPGEGRGPAG